MSCQHVVNRAFKSRNRNVNVLYSIMKVLPKEQVKHVCLWEVGLGASCVVSWEYITVDYKLSCTFSILTHVPIWMFYF